MEGITITLTSDKTEEFFFNSLCNIGGLISGAGGEIDYKDADYKAAKESLKAKKPNETICIEDVFLEVLKMGKTLTWKDIEGEGEYTRSITLKEVHERVAKMPTKHLMDFINENDDAVTAYVLLQQVFFDEQIFC